MRGLPPLPPPSGFEPTLLVSHPSSPTIKRPKLADASPHEAVPTGPFIAASDSWDDPDLDKNVQGLLQDVGLEAEYSALFRQHRISADLLAQLRAEDLLEMGVAAVGDRLRILQAIERSRGDADG
eukprot:EG_transcript_24266